MRQYKAPINEFMLILDKLRYENADFDHDTIAALLESTGDWVHKRLLPTNEMGDSQGVHFADGHVRVPEVFHDVHQEMIANGIFGLGLPAEWGGIGAPPIIVNMMMEMLSAGNLAFSTGSLLTSGAIATIDKYAAESLKAIYLPKMVAGQFSGTMCLTEPQCGTDLGLIRTKAVPDGEGYRITGSKIWISFGEHDLTDNIIHLVLARLPDAPPGVKGISLFLVPKRLEDGSENGVSCQGLEHKMGTHASPTCFMNYDNAEGHLIGEAHQGLKCMFHMMNAARLAVGVQALGVAEIAQQKALAFAQERRQSRAINPARRDEKQAADLIINHPDVRRMLLTVKSQIIPLRALVAYAGIALEKEQDALVGHLTPIVKSFCTERGTQLVSESLQVLGGMGYTRDGEIEQYLRDVRVTMIYEGTNAIQALDLVGRKMLKDQGATIRYLCQQMRSQANECAGFATCLRAQADLLEECLIWLAVNGVQDQELAAASVDFLRLVGICLMTFMWSKIIGSDEVPASAEFYLRMVAPEADLFTARVKSGEWVRNYD